MVANFGFPFWRRRLLHDPEPGCHRCGPSAPCGVSTRVFEAQKASTSREDIGPLSRIRGTLRAPGIARRWRSTGRGIDRQMSSVDKQHANRTTRMARRGACSTHRGIFYLTTSPPLPHPSPMESRRVEGPRARRGAMEGEGDDKASPPPAPLGRSSSGASGGSKKTYEGGCARAFPPGRC